MKTIKQFTFALLAALMTVSPAFAAEQGQFWWQRLWNGLWSYVQQNPKASAFMCAIGAASIYCTKKFFDFKNSRINEETNLLRYNIADYLNEKLHKEHKYTPQFMKEVLKKAIENKTLKEEIAKKDLIRLCYDGFTYYRDEKNLTDMGREILQKQWDTYRNKIISGAIYLYFTHNLELDEFEVFKKNNQYVIQAINDSVKEYKEQK